MADEREDLDTLARLSFANLIQNINLAQQNAVAAMQALNELGMTVVDKCVTLIATASPFGPNAPSHDDEDVATAQTGDVHAAAAAPPPALSLDIADMPAALANLALANRIFATALAELNAVTCQREQFLVDLAIHAAAATTVGKGPSGASPSV